MRVLELQTGRLEWLCYDLVMVQTDVLSIVVNTKGEVTMLQNVSGCLWLAGNLAGGEIDCPSEAVANTMILANWLVDLPFFRPNHILNCQVA